LKAYFQRIKFLIICLAIILIAYADCRLLFYWFNKSSFPEINFLSYLKISFYAVPFDLVALLYTNAIFIFILSLPIQTLHVSWFRNILKWIFLITNGIAILANCSDFVYFEFIHKRSTFDVFQLMSTQTDFLTLLPSFIKDFWYVFLITILFVFIIHLLYNYFYQKIIVSSIFQTENTSKQLKTNSIPFLLIIFFTVIGMRGGFQLIPIGLINAGDYVQSNSIPVLLNTPFSIMKSAELTTLEEKNFFNELELKSVYDPIHVASNQGNFKNENVVIIILESFSKEYTGLGIKNSHTPFLDSLMKHSLVFTNAIANGKRSIEGIPAILAGIPSMQEAFANTIYNSNAITSLASTLKQKGYSTSFYHGGNNGTMSFDSFCKSAGFDVYFGRNEYNNEADADEQWGIWDEPFLKKYAKDLSEMKQPFLSSVFTLSSHHPFKIPEKYKSKFKEGKLPIYKCVEYTDYALKQFFNEIKNKEFYKNTLFVITADHTGPPSDDYSYSQVGSFEIPLLFFKADHSLNGIDSLITQQIDIMPSVLGYLNYDANYFAFGNNVFDSTENRFAVNFHNQQYQYFMKKVLGTFDGNKLKEVFQFGNRNYFPLNNTIEKNNLDKEVKAFVQTYNYSLINNKMSTR
jgi:phosphoglycerol transferase MdoB-like AlkP superfamily enzyme